jgi:hypothetical protein
VQTVAALPTAPPAPAAPAPTPAPAQPPAPAAPKTYTEGEYDAQTKALADANAQIAALKAGVTPDAAADVIALAASRLKEGTDINAAIAAVLTQYPHFKSASAPTAPPLVAAPGAPNPPGSAPSTEDPFLQGLRSK